MYSFIREKLLNMTLPPNLVSLIREIGEYKGKQDLYKKTAREVLENLKKVAVIQSTESSNRIEGIEASHSRIKALVQDDSKPTNRHENEIAGYRDVLNTIHTSYEHIPFSENITLQLHRDLMKYTTHVGGKYKQTSNEISEYLPDGSRIIRFKPVEPYLVQESMKGLHQNYNDLHQLKEVDALVLVPLYVLDFLCIHPFLDGNGRLSRLLSILLLYQNGYDAVRYISLERIVEQTKEAYYDTLKRASQKWHDSDHDPLPWIEYFLSTLLASYKELDKKVSFLSEGSGTKTSIILEVIDGFIVPFTVGDIQELCPTVSIDMIRRVLKDQKQLGKVECVGKGRYAKWKKIDCS